MGFINKTNLLVLVAFFWVFIFKVEIPSAPIVQAAFSIEKIDTVIDSELINIPVSIQSSKKGFLKNLTTENFEIYDDGALQKIEFLYFEKSTNQYNIGFFPQIPATEKKYHKVKLKIKLSVEEKKQFGKIIISKKKWILSKAKR